MDDNNFYSVDEVKNNAYDLSIATQINTHVNNIERILRDFSNDEINKHRMDFLISNELMGIQKQCEKLGLFYINLNY